MSYAIYLRKSRKDLELHDTLSRHKNTLLELAKKQNLIIKHIYEEVVSGETIAARPQMQKLLDDVYACKYKGVLVVEIERLARGNTTDQGTVADAFKFSNTLIITPSKVYDPNDEFDEEYFEFGLFMSRREYKVINRRIQAGRLASVKEGKYTANVAPYGYNRIKLKNKKGWSLEPNPQEEKIVKLIFDSYVKNRIGVANIANLLNGLKVPTRKNSVWVPSTIQGILKNPVYIGKIKWGARKTIKIREAGVTKITRPRAKEYILVDGLHKPIIDLKIFKMAQDYLNNHRVSPKQKDKTIKNPLAGLIVCSKCKRKMIRRPYKKQSPSLICSLKGCDNVSSPLHVVEEKLFKTLDVLIKSYELESKASNNNFNDTSLQENSLKFLNLEKDKVEKQLNNLHDLLEQGIYDINKFIERSNILNNKLKNINKDLTTIKSQINSISAQEVNKIKILPKLKNLKDLYYNEKDITLKNKLLKEVIQNVVYTKTKNCRWHNSLDDFELVIYPKIPTK